jgi:glycylpeptide N-tetradecanoyltransferase
MNRFINCKRLAEMKYTNKPDSWTMKQFEQRYRLPAKDSIKIEGTIRKMEKKDISAVLKLHMNQQKKYKVYYKMSQDDIIHYLLPKDEVVWTYVIEDDN